MGSSPKKSGVGAVDSLPSSELDKHDSSQAQVPGSIPPRAFRCHWAKSLCTLDTTHPLPQKKGGVGAVDSLPSSELDKHDSSQVQVPGSIPPRAFRCHWARKSLCTLITQKTKKSGVGAVDSLPS